MAGNMYTNGFRPSHFYGKSFCFLLQGQMNREDKRYHSFSTYTKFSEKLNFLRTGSSEYQGVRNVCFSENFAYVLNE